MSKYRFHLDEGEENRLSDLEYVFRYGSVRDMERLMIMQRLAENDQNRTRAAKTLDISVRTIRNKLRLYRERPVVADETHPILGQTDL